MNTVALTFYLTWLLKISISGHLPLNQDMSSLKKITTLDCEHTDHQRTEPQLIG